VYEQAEQLLEDLRAGKLSPEIVLMDIVLPGISGIEATRRLKERHPQVEVLMLTIFEEEEKILEAISAGASGYLLKNTRPGDLTAQIKELAGGGSPISPHAARKLFAELQRGQHHSSGNQYNLTAREREIVRAVAEGLTYREIADRCGIAGSTVKKHILNIYRKMEVSSRVEFMKKVMGSDLL
jgi:DNA-binding NarL/FixJ family response regulator